jgi:hypothetical protein
MRILGISVILLVVLSTINVSVNAYKSYSQYQLWRLHVTNNEQVAQLLDFSRIAHQHKINFWSEEFRTNIPVNLQIEHFNRSISLSF